MHYKVVQWYLHMDNICGWETEAPRKGDEILKFEMRKGVENLWHIDRNISSRHTL